MDGKLKKGQNPAPYGATNVFLEDCAGSSNFGEKTHGWTLAAFLRALLPFFGRLWVGKLLESTNKFRANKCVMLTQNTGGLPETKI